MNKKIETYYAIVSVEEGLPEKEKVYPVITKYSNEPTQRHFDGTQFTNYDGYKVTHWLSEQQGVVLSVEEWEKVQKCIDALKDYVASDEGAPRSSYINAKKALSQLNTKP